MQLVNLKADSDDAQPEMAYGSAKYGYGLCLSLNEDQCELLGISKALTAGTKVNIQAVGIVVSATESVERDGDDKGNDVSLQVQITDMGMEAGQVLRNAAAILYGGE